MSYSLFFKRTYNVNKIKLQPSKKKAKNTEEPQQPPGEVGMPGAGSAEDHNEAVADASTVGAEKVSYVH